MALRTSPMPAPWPAVIAAITVIGSAATFWTSLSGSRTGKASEDLWKALILLFAVVMVVRRILARPTVTVQSIYGALSAYLIIGLMFASVYAALDYLGTSDFFADSQPANTQTYQYFSFTTLDHPRVRRLHRRRERQPLHCRPGGDDRPGVPGHPGGPSRYGVPRPGPASAVRPRTAT